MDEAYREMQKNYVTLEAVANRVLDMPHTPEWGQVTKRGHLGLVMCW